MPAPWLRWAIIGSIAAALALVAAGLWSLLASRTAGLDRRNGRRRGSGQLRTRSRRAGRRTEAPPPAPPSFDEVLARHGNDTTTEAALGKLFASWGATYDPSGGRGCDQAAHQGLECLFQKGSWAQLANPQPPGDPHAHRRHRPHPPGAARPASATRRPPSTSAANARACPIAAMSRYWFGDFLLLWRPPLAVGEGARARHARRRRALAAGEPARRAGPAGRRRPAATSTTRTSRAWCRISSASTGSTSTASPACRRRSCSTRW